MSTEKLKEQARRHEQKEEWQKALDQYQKAIAKLAEQDQPDIGLYNRVGDLFVRVGKLDDAVSHYEQAVDLYLEAELPNNAIAVCKKVIRNVPERYEIFLKMGQIRGRQGFMPDARTNYLTYAERAVQAGALDESFEALTELADLVPDDVELRLMVGEQLASHDRAEDAVEQMAKAFQQFTLMGKANEAEAVESRIRQLDPDADIGALAAAAPSHDFGTGFEAGGALPQVGEIEADFGEIDTGEEEAAEAVAEAAEEAAGVSVGEFDIAHGGEEAEELPMMGFDSEDEGEEAPELPMMGFDSEDEGEEAAELPMMDFDAGDEGEEAAELPMMDLDASDEGEEAAGAADGLDASAFGAPDHGEREDKEYVEGGEEMGEISVDLGDMTLGGEEPAEAVEEAKEEAAAEQKAAPAAAPAEGYVDLGSMILGDDEEKSTRFVVAYEEPSGDEEADFAKMLAQFKDKVSESLESDDVKSHYDLGTAYKEMGLLDEAISEFQQALRASATHLPTYEVMGQTFLEMGNADAAVRSLNRALQVDYEVEDELVGIYYYLARAYEQAGNKENAVEFYDRVFALDINFADVTERLRALR